jgi:site-specific recombinase XerC
MKGIRRTKGTAPVQKAAALSDDIRAMVEASEGSLLGARDRALVLLGFAGAFRRSELVGLDVGDCVFGRDGVTVTLRRSKTDQDGAGRKLGSLTARTRTRARFASCRRGSRRPG